MVETEKVKDGRMEIMDVHLVPDRTKTKIISLPVSHSTTDSTPRKKHGKPVVVVITPVAILRHGCSSEFSTPNHQSVLEQAATLEIPEEGSNWLVNIPAMLLP